MRKFLLTLILTSLTMPFAVNAEEVKGYVPLLQEGKVWKYVGYNVEYFPLNGEWFSLIELAVDSKVEIDGEEYFKLVSTVYGDYDQPYYGEIYMQEDVATKRVWCNYRQSYPGLLIGLYYELMIGEVSVDWEHVLIYDFENMKRSEIFYDSNGNPYVADPNFIEGVGYAPRTESYDLWKIDSSNYCQSFLAYYSLDFMPGGSVGPLPYLYEVVDADGETIYYDEYAASHIGLGENPHLDGVESISDEAEAQAEWYNLQGVRVENPGQGMYIRRQGNSVNKVMLK